jgi:hypothetical protein
MRIAAALALSSLLALSASAASFVVTTTSPSGAGSLRQAMLDANASGEDSLIEFNLSGKPPFTIDVDAPLPVMTVPVYIVATTQPGFAGRPITTIASHVPGRCSTCAAATPRWRDCVSFSR